ncbi:MAG: pyridoxamine 5'-phosphate oxidase family protein, partial [Candidatus Nitrosopolaris sp.]
MQLIKRLEIQPKQRIIDFLNSEPVGRISTIDVDGYPQVIPMNFVYVRGIDMREHPRRLVKIDADYM